MNDEKKCTSCGVDVPSDAGRAAYLHVVDGIVTGVRSFALCPGCMRRAKKHPHKVVGAMRRAYTAGLN